MTQQVLRALIATELRINAQRMIIQVGALLRALSAFSECSNSRNTLIEYL